MTRVEALDTARDVLEGYMTGNGAQDDAPDFKEAYEVLTKMRDSIQKQNYKNKIRRMAASQSRRP